MTEKRGYRSMMNLFEDAYMAEKAENELNDIEEPIFKNGSAIFFKIREVADKEHVKKIRDALKETQGYCPCVPPWAITEDHKCMCKDFRDAPVGSVCHCGLYEKVEVTNE